MNNDMQRFDAIQNYLDGKMSAAERQAFEAQMATDADLADEVGVHRLEREMMDILLEDDLSGQMQAWQKEKEHMQAESGRPWRFIIGTQTMRIAATIVVIVSIGIVLLVLKLRRNESGYENSYADKTEQNDGSSPEKNIPPSIDQQKEETQEKKNEAVADTPRKSAEDQQQQNTKLIALAEEFGGTPDFSGIYIRSGEETKSRYDSAAVFIQEKRYDAAIGLLQTISNDNPETYLNAQLNLGYLYFLKKNFKASIPHLERAAANRDFLYAEAADWYLSLAYLGNGQKAAALKKLDSILTDKEHTYYQKANQLKNQLE